MYRVRRQIGYDDSFYGRDNPNAFSVAVLDSGIALHPDFGNRIVAFYDFNENRGNRPYDHMGHGTHVSGCILGDGKLSAGRYKGICPKANLVMGKILDSTGAGTGGQMIKGLEWILEKRQAYKIKVLNISLGVEKKMSRVDLSHICGMIRELIDSNVVVVCAAGNYGPSDNSIYGIGAMPEVITVGCYDGIFAGQGGRCCENYSGRGPKDSHIIKPDIVAPGTAIVSCAHNVQWKKHTGYRNAYIQKSGTSMSAPIISGIVMSIFLHKPDLTAGEMKEIIRKGTIDVGMERNRQGYGMTNCKRIKDLIVNT